MIHECKACGYRQGSDDNSSDSAIGDENFIEIVIDLFVIKQDIPFPANLIACPKCNTVRLYDGNYPDKHIE